MLLIVTCLTLLSLHTSIAQQSAELFGPQSDSDTSREVMAEILETINSKPQEQENEIIRLLDFLSPPNHSERLREESRNLENILDALDVRRPPAPVSRESRLLRLLKAASGGRAGSQVPDKRTAEDPTSPIKLQRRTCRVRLGGVCATHDLDKAVKMYHYLMSSDSPGKRRRRSLNKAVGGAESAAANQPQTQQ